MKGAYNMQRYVLSVLVENHAGVLSRVSGLFSRRGYNIDSLTVGETHNPGQSRMTIVVSGDEYILDQIKKQLSNTKSLHFDDYSFEGEVDDFFTWTMQGADYNVWNLTPLIKDIQEIKENSDCEYLLLDYPFAYCHKELSEYIDCAIFIDTPLDIAMARRILRDMKNATGEEIRQDLKMYIKYARAAYIQMLKDILPSSDYIIDGTKEIEERADEIIRIILSL